MRYHVTEEWVRDESVQLDDAAAALVVEKVLEALGADAKVNGNAQRIVTRVTVEAVSDQAAAQAGEPRPSMSCSAVRSITTRHSHRLSRRRDVGSASGVSENSLILGSLQVPGLRPERW